jgi:hypothetical protein
MKCGICDTQIEGKVRALNIHKAAAHPDIREAARKRHKSRATGRGVSMNYCPSCQKFVSLEPGEPEDQGVDITDNSISGQIRLVLTCSGCSQELHESTVEVEEEFTLDHEEGCPETEGADISTIEWSLDEEGGGRFSKHLYFASGTAEVSCSECKAALEIELVSEKVAASYFESLT